MRTTFAAACLLASASLSFAQIPAVPLSAPGYALGTGTSFDASNGTLVLPKGLPSTCSAGQITFGATPYICVSANTWLAVPLPTAQGGVIPTSFLPSVGALSGQLTLTQIPQLAVPITHQFVTGIANQGVVSQAQPAFTDISGTMSASQMPALSGGDVTSNTGSVALTVNSVGGSSSTNIHSAEAAANAATSANGANTIVKRDASGNFSAGTVTATLNGTATNVTGTVTIPNGGTGATSAPDARVALGLGTAAIMAGPTGAIVGTTDSQTLTNKLLTKSEITDLPGFPSGTIIGDSDTQTLTNKTVDGVSPTTLGYLDATSSIQTQLNSKQSTIATNTYDAYGTAATLSANASNLTIGTVNAARLPSSVLQGTQVNVITNQVAPGSAPSLGQSFAWTDATGKNLRVQNDTGVTTVTVLPVASAPHYFLTGISASGVFTSTQPSASDIAGLAPSATVDALNASNITSGTIAPARLPTATSVAAGAITVGAGFTLNSGILSVNSSLFDASGAASALAASLSAVAMTGDYNSLVNKPYIPTSLTITPATATVVGGIKCGTDIVCAGDGTASVNTGAFDAAGAASSAQAASLQQSANLGDLASASTARTNLGLGSAATQALTAFDAVGTAAAAVAAIPTAGAGQSNAALLTHADWLTFNGKQPALGYTPPNPANALSEYSGVASATRASLGLGGAAILNVQGSGTKVATFTGSYTSGHCLDVDVSGNIMDAGAACGSGGSGSSSPATTTTLGSVIVKTGLTVDFNGNLSVAYGTTSGTSAQGNDGRILGALQSSNNLSDIANQTVARGNLGLGSAAVLSASSVLGDPGANGLVYRSAAGSSRTALSGDVNTLLGYTPVNPASLGAAAYLPIQGTATKIAGFSGTFTSGHCLDLDVSGNITDAGAACGSGSGSSSPATTSTLGSVIVSTGLAVDGSGNLSVAYGTTAGTAAQGNDTRITGAAQKAANLSDLASASTARTNLGLGSAATLNTSSVVLTSQVGAASGVAPLGADTKIPLAYIPSIGTAPNAYAFTNQSTVSIAHNLNTLNVILACYDTGNRYMPSWQYSLPDANHVTVNFLNAVSGWCTVNGGVGPQGQQGIPGSGGGITQLTGDVTTASGTGAQAATLATVNSNVGTFGDATHTAQIAVNGKGLITGVSSVAITGTGGGNYQTVQVNATGQTQAATLNLAAGSNITLSGATTGGVTTVTINSTGGGAAITTGPTSGLTGLACSTGALYFATDQPAGQQLYQCSATNTWTQTLQLGPTGALAVTSGALDIVPSVVPRMAATNVFTGSNTFASAQITPTTVSTLPACNLGTEGMIRSVTDSTTNTWGATITGGGTSHVGAYCDSANWTVLSK